MLMIECAAAAKNQQQQQQHKKAITFHEAHSTRRRLTCSAHKLNDHPI